MSDQSSGDDEQSFVVNQLIAEFISRTDAGESLTPDQFIAEHPEQTTDLKRHFSNVGLLDSLNETRAPVHDETILNPDNDSKQPADDATTNTVMRGGTDSETSVTRQLEVKSSSSASSLDIPDTFGRYAIQKVLGQGAMGAVYLARDTQLDRDVALKIPKFGDGNGVDEEELLERFYREARASATLRSLNICPVYDVGEIDGQHYITMAYIEGRPLKDFTKSKKRHSEKQIITTIRKLATGLEQAHRIGVIHRDLKPANIIVDQQGEPVVMDFGLARRSSSDDVQVTQSGAILGTPAYMAPEQVAGDHSAIDHRVDIYALGVIMYELITGEMPFKGNLIATLQQIALNNPKKPSELRKDIDPRLETICLKMMAGDQTQRYQSMQQVADDLQKVLRNPGKRQKEDQPKTPGPKPTSIPTASEESNPALISIEEPKSYAEQLREKKRRPTRKSARSSGQSGSKGKPGQKAASNGPPKKGLIAGGVGGLLLLLGIVFFVRVGKYDVQITLDDPSITLSVDGETLNINDGSEVIKLSAGEHKLQLQKDGLTTHVEEFTVSKDGKTSLTAKVVNGQLDALLNGEKPRLPILSSTVPMKDSASNSIAGEVRYSLEFDGVNSRVEFPVIPFDPLKPLTVEAWFTAEPQKASGQLNVEAETDAIWSLVNPGSLATASFIVDRPNEAWWAATGNDQHARAIYYWFTRDDKRDDLYKKRHHAAIVFDGTEIRMYLDGQPVQSGIADITIPDETYRPSTLNTFLLGAGVDRDGKTLSRFLLGSIDEFRFSTVARYSQPFEPDSEFEKDHNTLALYHFDEGFGDVLKDSSGNGHHGKILGAKWVRVDPRTTTKTIEQPAVDRVSLEFDGKDVVHVDSIQYDPKQPFTLEAAFSWQYIYELTAGAVFVGRDEGVESGRGPAGGARFAAFSNDHLAARLGEVMLEGGDIPTKAERVHLAMVHTGKELLGFRDGKLFARAETTGHDLGPGVGRFLIGAGLVGKYEMLRLSKTARYDEDFVPQTRFAPDDQTIALYNFDKATGDVLEDSSGNGHHGKIIGAKWITPESAASADDDRKVAE